MGLVLLVFVPADVTFHARNGIESTARSLGLPAFTTFFLAEAGLAAVAAFLAFASWRSRHVVPVAFKPALILGATVAIALVAFHVAFLIIGTLLKLSPV